MHILNTFLIKFSFFVATRVTLPSSVAAALISITNDVSNVHLSGRSAWLATLLPSLAVSLSLSL